MAKKDMINDDENPHILTELPNPWSRGKGNNGEIDYDGDQMNGRHGSPKITVGASQDYENSGPVKFDKQDDTNDSIYEKKMGVLINPTGQYKDIHNGFEVKEVDLSKHVEVIGMPTANINNNSSDDCYGS